MPPKGWSKPKARTLADYDRGIQMLGAIDRIAGILAQEFPELPRVLLVTTALSDAHKELSKERDALANRGSGDESQQEGTK